MDNDLGWENLLGLLHQRVVHRLSCIAGQLSIAGGIPIFLDTRHRVSVLPLRLGELASLPVAPLLDNLLDKFLFVEVAFGRLALVVVALGEFDFVGQMVQLRSRQTPVVGVRLLGQSLLRMLHEVGQVLL